MIKYLFLLLVSFCPLVAEIYETSHFKEIVDYINAETLLILDIDDTLLLPVQTLGNDAWFIYRWEQNSKHLSKLEALEKSLDEWEAVRHLTKVKLVEEGTDEIISSLQVRLVPIMGLTTQGCALATCTINQLKSLQIDLSKTSPSPNDCYFMNRLGVLYRQGILFTSGTEKGPALIKFLNQINYHPQRIVFINDKATHLKDVESSVIAAGMEFIGLRYNIGDERVANFDAKLADYQWHHSTFSHILSDEEVYARDDF